MLPVPVTATPVLHHTFLHHATITAPTVPSALYYFLIHSVAFQAAHYSVANHCISVLMPDYQISMNHSFAPECDCQQITNHSHSSIYYSYIVNLHAFVPVLHYRSATVDAFASNHDYPYEVYLCNSQLFVPIITLSTLLSACNTNL